MAEIKFTGVKFEYNNIKIDIAADTVGISQIGISGVKIGNASDFDRMLSLAPTTAKIYDASLIAVSKVGLNGAVNFSINESQSSGHPKEGYCQIGSMGYTFKKKNNDLIVTRAQVD